MALKKAGSFQTCQVFFSDLLDISFNFAGDLGLDAGDCNFGFDDTKNCNLHASTHLRIYDIDLWERKNTLKL